MCVDGKKFCPQPTSPTSNSLKPGSVRNRNGNLAQGERCRRFTAHSLHNSIKRGKNTVYSRTYRLGFVGFYRWSTLLQPRQHTATFFHLVMPATKKNTHIQPHLFGSGSVGMGMLSVQIRPNPWLTMMDGGQASQSAGWMAGWLVGKMLVTAENTFHWNK